MNKRKITRIIRNSFLGRSKIWFYFRFLTKKKQLISTINQFTSSDCAVSDKAIVPQMRKAMVNYRWEFDEFFLYHFPQLSHKERLSFVTEYEKNIFCDMVNDPSCQEVFDNKWLTYKTFKKYYGREILLSTNITDKDFEDFVERSPVFIVKPLVSSLGKGIKKQTFNNKERPKAMLDRLNQEYPKGFIIEELIVQDPSLAVLHPQSVNTLRVHTIKLKDRIEVFKPYLRIGVGDSVVDNAGAGGIFTSVDFNTGVITKAVDERGKEYTTHPDTQVNLIGFKIPHWHEALNIAQDLAGIIPENRYTGWDLAHTAKGWVMIEGNTRAQMVFQIPEQKGFRTEFEAMKSRIN